MRILALETATSAVAVAVASSEGVLAETTVRSDRRHGELLHPAIGAVLAHAGVHLAELDAVAADVGPGLFTGIRVGVSAAKALALARGIPAVAVTSLDAVAEAVREAAVTDRIVPVVDLRRGEVAWRLDETSHGPIETLVAALTALGEPVVVAGDGARRYARELASSHVRLAGPLYDAPPVGSLAVLACEAFSAGRTLDPAELAPCYLREADTRINWTTRHDRPREER